MTGSNFGDVPDKPVVSDREFSLLQQLNEARAELAEYKEKKYKEDSRLLDSIVKYGFDVVFEPGDQEAGLPACFQVWTSSKPKLSDPEEVSGLRMLANDQDIRKAIKMAVITHVVEQNPKFDGAL